MNHYENNNNNNNNNTNNNTKQQQHLTLQKQNNQHKQLCFFFWLQCDKNLPPSFFLAIDLEKNVFKTSFKFAIPCCHFFLKNINYSQITGKLLLVENNNFSVDLSFWCTLLLTWKPSPADMACEWPAPSSISSQWSPFILRQERITATTNVMWWWKVPCDQTPHRDFTLHCAQKEQCNS